MEPDYWYAAFKLGKYVDRMIDAVPNLGGYLSEENLIDIQNMDEFEALKLLAAHHVVNKNNKPLMADPKNLQIDEYFKAFNDKKLKLFKGYALTLGAKVRSQVAIARASKPQPIEQAPTESTTLPPATALTSSVPVEELAQAQEVIKPMLARLDTIEEKSES